MKATLVKSVVMGLGAAAAIAASASLAVAATPEERAKCEKMIKDMGAAAPHSHGAEKGQGLAPMTAEHARCNAILAEGKGKDAQSSDKK